MRADTTGIHPEPEEINFFFGDADAVHIGKIELVGATASFGLPATVSRLL